MLQDSNNCAANKFKKTHFFHQGYQVQASQTKTSPFIQSLMKNNTFTVEKILNKRKNLKREVEYLVKWLGYQHESDLTWEPISHLTNCAELIDQYEQSARHNTAIRTDPKTDPKTDHSSKNLKRPRPNSSSVSKDKRTTVKESDADDGDEIYEEESNNNEDEEYANKAIKKQTAIRSSKPAAPEPAKKGRVFRKTAAQMNAMEQENQDQGSFQQNLNQLCTGNKGKCEVQAIIRDKDNKSSFLFKVKVGKQEKTVPKDELMEEDPYSLLYYYEKNIQFIANK